MSLKRLSNNKSTLRQGFDFGIGFWLAFFVFFSIILPALFCLIAIILATLGYSIG